MYRRHGEKLGLVFLACDLTITVAAWLIAYALRFTFWPAPDGVPNLDAVLRPLPLLLILAAVAYRAAGLYDVHRLRQLPSEWGVVLRGSGLLFLLAVAAVFYRRELYESRLALGTFAALLPLGLVASRYLLWGALRRARSRGLNHSRALIVGSGRLARRVSQIIHKNRWTGLEAIGFVEDDPATRLPGLSRLGSIDELASIIEQQDVDHVFVALPLARYGELCGVYQALSQLLVEVQLVPDIPSLTGMRVRMLEVQQTCFLSLREDPHAGWRRVTKRGLDVAGALAALALFSPLMLLIAALVKLTSRGPVLYRQPRTSLAGAQFSMLKFRSMRINAEQATGPVWTHQNDARCTAIGHWLRRYSLDELPQLFNVLVGDMSLVGPRPERQIFAERFCGSIPGYLQRQQVKSGMTGWAQINGWRGNTSVRRRVEYDLYYIANWTLWFDVKILWLTLWRGFRQDNAY
ncbi:MAG: undecaprenyl-phosphate glucose phosphotransferase [Pirellulales bacterium]|nr:undecaprenyl-phosphate glucose phosphotransferase [Pirellulales bacterium]